jgi:hypothetical protein
MICMVKCHVLVVYGLRYHQSTVKKSRNSSKENSNGYFLEGMVEGPTNKLLPVFPLFSRKRNHDTQFWNFLLYWGFVSQRGEVRVRILELSTACKN